MCSGLDGRMGLNECQPACGGSAIPTRKGHRRRPRRASGDLKRTARLGVAAVAAHPGPKRAPLGHRRPPAKGHAPGVVLCICPPQSQKPWPRDMVLFALPHCTGWPARWSAPASAAVLVACSRAAKLRQPNRQAARQAPFAALVSGFGHIATARLISHWSALHAPMPST